MPCSREEIQLASHMLYGKVTNVMDTLRSWVLAFLSHLRTAVKKIDFRVPLEEGSVAITCYTCCIYA